MGGQLIIRIGRKIRETRLRQQMKLQEVAGSAGISKGLLSRIENGRTVPSLPVLLSLIQALKVPIDAFFGGIDLAPPAPYVHRKAFEYASPGEATASGLLSAHILSQNVLNVALEASILTLQPGTRREPATTDGYGFKYVLKGEVEYRLGDDTVLLQTGDSLFFNGQTPHVPHNPTTQPASLLVIYLLPAQG